ncbi:MAG: GNAT family N-acetyltransferase [Ekhidna sp.]
MRIREAQIKDLDQILTLFEETVKHIDIRDYSEAHLNVWSSSKNQKAWLQKIKEQSFYVAAVKNQIVGFSSIDSEGYLDFMYVHHQLQRQGVATALLEKIESHASKMDLKRIWASVSITAQPFFSKNGYEHYEDEHKMLSGVHFKNALMEKIIMP